MEKEIVAEFLNYPIRDTRYFILKRSVANYMYKIGLEKFRDYVMELTKKWHNGAKEQRDENLKEIYALRCVK